MDILKKRGKIKFALILLEKISYGGSSPLFQDNGIFLIIHWKLGLCKNKQICRHFFNLATILLLIDRPACAGFIWFPSKPIGNKQEFGDDGPWHSRCLVTLRHFGKIVFR